MHQLGPIPLFRPLPQPFQHVLSLLPLLGQLRRLACGYNVGTVESLHRQREQLRLLLAQQPARVGGAAGARGSARRGGTDFAAHEDEVVRVAEVGVVREGEVWLGPLAVLFVLF